MIPQAEISCAFAEEEEGAAVSGDVSNSPAGVDLPLAERAQLSLNDHSFNIILNHQNNQYFITHTPSNIHKLSFNALNDECWLLFLVEYHRCRNGMHSPSNNNQNMQNPAVPAISFTYRSSFSGRDSAKLP